MNAADVLEQAGRLGCRLCQRVRHVVGDRVDLAADLAGDVPRHKIVDLINCRERTDRLVAQRNLGVNEKLLGELDDRPVSAADVLAGTTCVRRPETTWMIRSMWYGSNG